jgi:hypothetical protein
VVMRQHTVIRFACCIVWRGMSTKNCVKLTVAIHSFSNLSDDRSNALLRLEEYIFLIEFLCLRGAE